jgi:hypothetical protein
MGMIIYLRVGLGKAQTVTYTRPIVQLKVATTAIPTLEE